jgi:hypothetical protein
MSYQGEKKLEASLTAMEIVCPIYGSDQPRPLFWTKDYVFGCTEDSFR